MATRGPRLTKSKQAKRCRRFRDKNPEYVLYANAKTRARQLGLPFDITRDDIVVPEYCPVLGIKLTAQVGKRGGNDSSPSLDRIRPERGYVRGNIVVVSNRANRIKADATLRELKLITRFYERLMREKTNHRR